MWARDLGTGWADWGLLSLSNSLPPLNSTTTDVSDTIDRITAGPSIPPLELKIQDTIR